MCVETIMRFFRGVKRKFKYKKCKVDKIQKALEEQLDKDIETLLMDRKFWTTSLDNIDEVLELDNTDKLEYISERFDCNGFAFKLMGHFCSPELGGIPFGVLLTKTPDGGYHAMNVFVDKELDVYIVEPQTDEIIPADKFLDKGFKPIMVIMS